MPPCLLVQAATCPPILSAGRSLSAFGGAQEFLAVLQPQAAAPEARLEERLHPLRAVHEGVDFSEQTPPAPPRPPLPARTLRQGPPPQPHPRAGQARPQRTPHGGEPAHVVAAR